MPPKRYRKTLLRPGTTATPTAHLTLAIGSRAGMAAPLQLGYYMIGRHRECQLRPKSRSVSRRHCLIHHSEHGLRVMDLKSTTGTLVNDRAMEPHQWTVLSDGDMLRCGKVLFSVGVELNQPESHVVAESSDTVASLVSMTTGDPWQEANVAEFLNAADDADREQRYRGIRMGNRQPKPLSLGESDNEQGGEWDTSDFEDDGEVVVEIQAESAADSAVSGQDKGGGKRPTKAKAKKTKQPPVIPKPRRSSGFSLPSLSFPSFSSTNRDPWKTIGAVVLTIGMVGFCCYTTYQAFYGEDVRVVHGID